MVDKIIADIDTSLKHGAFLAAITLALTLPDICGKAKHPSKGSKYRYISWYNEYVEGAKKPNDPYAKDLPYLSGELVYNFRCKVLHQGTLNVEKSEISEIDCQVDKLILYITEEGAVNKDFQEVKYGRDLNDVQERCIHVDLRHLCNIIQKAAKEYYGSNKELFNFFNYILIDEREEKRIIRELVERSKNHE